MEEENLKGKSKHYSPRGFFKLMRYGKTSDHFLMAIGVLASVVSGLGAPANSYIFGNLAKAFVDYSPDKKEEFLKEVDEFSLFNSLIGVGLIVFSYVSIVLYITSTRREIYRIRLEYFQSALKQDIGWYDMNKTGDFASKMSEDLNKLEDGMSEKILQVVHSLSSFTGCITLALIKGWKLALISLSCIPILLLSLKGITIFSSKVSKNQFIAYAKAAAVAEEVLSSIRTVVAFNGQNKEIERYKQHLLEARKNNIRKSFFTGLTYGVMWFLLYCSYSLTFWYGILFVYDEGYTPGQMTTIFFSVMVGTINLLITAPYVEVFAAAKVASDTVFSVIQRKSPIDPTSEEGKKPAKIRGDIELRNVIFRYPSRPEVPILRGISLKIKKGETVAFVGNSGCGKSTCIQLIQRFYDPIEGQVLIDGEDIKNLNVKHLRKHIGVVGQEPVLFSTSIKDNIRYGKEEATDKEIARAAQMANAHKFISKLPKGYSTLVGERGAQMSGGQKQRIAIARALIRNPSILLLDEATSALDNESEAKVQEALDKASKGRTTIIVAHRLSTIRHANKIVVLSKGEIVEEGTHEELYEKKGYYYDLITAQKPPPEKVPAVNLEDRVERKLDSRLSESSSSGFFKEYPADVETVEEKKVTIAKILKMNSPEWLFVTIGTLASMLVGFCTPLATIVFGDVFGVFQQAERDEALEETKTYCLWFVLIGTLMGVATIIQTYFFGMAGEKLTMRLRILTFSAMLKQEMAWFDDRTNTVGALCARLSGDTNSIQSATGQPVGSLVQGLATFGLGVGFSMYFQWKLGLTTLCLVPLLFTSSLFLTKSLGGNAKKTQKVLEKSTKIAIEAVANIRTVAALGREIQFYKEYEKELKPTNKILVRGAHVKGILMGGSRALMYFSYAVCIYYGGRLIAYEGENYTHVLKVTNTIILGSFFLAHAFGFTSDFQKGVVAARELIHFLKREPNIHDPDIELVDSKWTTQGNVSYVGIEFKYPTRPKDWILKNFTLEVLKGKKVALVGHSGCGKSTLIQLLERFYDPEVGERKLDSYDITDMKLKTLRKQLGIVSQEPVLFDRTIAQNIAYGDNDREVPMSEIIEAAMQANVHGFVSSLPMGYETTLGEKGTQLSGGQKQRVAIARALIRKPKVLLLDEATSALDTQSEKVVQEALDKAGIGRTCITIAHRLTTIIDADVIVVIHQGKVAEMGTHAELLAKQGIYWELYMLQSGS